jgi:hypothetical protein
VISPSNALFFPPASFHPFLLPAPFLLFLALAMYLNPLSLSPSTCSLRQRKEVVGGKWELPCDCHDLRAVHCTDNLIKNAVLPSLWSLPICNQSNAESTLILININTLWKASV